MTIARLPQEGPSMNEPGQGSRQPDEPVTVTLPYRTAKRVLVAVVADAQRANSRGKDPAGVEQLARASDVIGDAIDAPAHRRFALPRAMLWAVIAGTPEEYSRWVKTVYDQLSPAEQDTRYVGRTIYIDSVEEAFGHVYAGYSVYGTADRRPDCQELVAAVKSRTFRRER